MTERTKTVEAIIAAKMEQRFSVGGLRNEEEELLDELVGADYAIRPLWNHKAASASGSVGSLSRGNRDACASRNTELSPLLTNRGVLTTVFLACSFDTKNTNTC